MRWVWLATTVVAACLAPQAQAASNPSFKVTVTSTFVRHHVVHVARTPLPNGCSLRTDSDATQKVVAKTAQPVVVTLRELQHGVDRFAGLGARETRRGSYRYGYNDGCPYLQTNPAEISDTSGCGTRSSYILSEKVKLGFLRGTNHFRFAYERTGPDAFVGKCLVEVFVGENEYRPGAESVSMPPQQWLKKPQRRWWTTLAAAKLRSGKRVVVRWKDSATFSTPPFGDPAGYTEFVDNDTYTVSWTVTLTPVTRTSR